MDYQRRCVLAAHNRELRVVYHLMGKTGWSTVAVNGTHQTRACPISTNFRKGQVYRAIQAERRGTGRNEQIERTFPFGNFGLPFKKSRFLRKFSVWENQNRLPIYIPTKISGFLWQMVNNQDLTYPMKRGFTVDISPILYDHWIKTAMAKLYFGWANLFPIQSISEFPENLLNWQIWSSPEKRSRVL